MNETNETNETNEESKLNFCNFCLSNENLKVVERNVQWDDRTYHQVQCNTCGRRGSIALRRKIAIREWNNENWSH